MGLKNRNIGSLRSFLGAFHRKFDAHVRDASLTSTDMLVDNHMGCLARFWTHLHLGYQANLIVFLSELLRVDEALALLVRCRF